MNTATDIGRRCPLSTAGRGDGTETPVGVSVLSMIDRALFTVYLALAILGAAVTWYFNLTFDPTGGEGYLEAWFANSASSSAAADLIVVAVAGAILIVVESRRLAMKGVWLHLAAIPFVAIAFSLPLFLARRHITIARSRS